MIGPSVFCVPANGYQLWNLWAFSPLERFPKSCQLDQDSCSKILSPLIWSFPSPQDRLTGRGGSAIFLVESAESRSIRLKAGILAQWFPAWIPRTRKNPSSSSGTKRGLSHFYFIRDFFFKHTAICVRPWFHRSPDILIPNIENT